MLVVVAAAVLNQAKASVAAHEALRDLAKASTTLAVAGAVSSAVIAVAVAGLVGFSLLRRE